MLTVVTVIWGYGFVATRLALDSGVGTGMINLLRGGIFALLTLVFYFKQIVKMTKKEFLLGLFIGVINAAAFILQTVGLEYTTPANSSFITVTYVLFVPFIALVAYKKRPTLKLFICVAICLAGTAVLTGFIGGQITLNIGDLYCLLCAMLYAVAICFVANSARDIHFSKLTFMFGITQAIGGALYFLIFDGAGIGQVDIKKAVFPILYLGIASSFLAQTGQVIAQQNISAVLAALIMTLEGVFGCIFSVIFGFDKLTWMLTAGGLLIVLSVALYQIPLEKTALARLLKKGGGKSPPPEG